MSGKTPLQTVMDALNKASTILKSHPTFKDENDLVEVEASIKEDQQKIEKYKSAHGDVPYPINDIDWINVPEKVNVPEKK
jgi:hypothetical protein